MVDQAFQTLKTFDWGSDPKQLSAIDDAVIATHGDAAKRLELEEHLLDTLHADIPHAAKDFIFRKLKTIGTATSVAPLAAMLDNEKLAHLARYALESNPAPEAGAALRASLTKLSGALQAGVIASLGVRQDDEAVPALESLLGSDDAVVATAAAQALGAIRSSSAAKALNSAKPNPEATGAATDAALACAEAMLAGGNKIGALAVYRRLAKGDPPKHVKLAATRGILACAGQRSS